MERVVEPEFLDQLPPSDARAVRSRGDLRRINFLMGNVSLLAGLLQQQIQKPPRTIVELGAGDGTMMLALARKLCRPWPGVKLQLLDMQPVIQDQTLREFRELGWQPEIVQAELKDWIRTMPQTDLVLANLFLHHFSDPELREIFTILAERTGSFASCEPRRWTPALVTTHLLWAIGCNGVTRHDAIASVRAGFRDRELSALWPRGQDFDLVEKSGNYASHLFCARRRNS